MKKDCVVPTVLCNIFAPSIAAQHLYVGNDFVFSLSLFFPCSFCGLVCDFISTNQICFIQYEYCAQHVQHPQQNRQNQTQPQWNGQTTKSIPKVGEQMNGQIAGNGKRFICENTCNTHSHTHSMCKRLRAVDCRQTPLNHPTHNGNKT